MIKKYNRFAMQTYFYLARLHLIKTKYHDLKTPNYKLREFSHESLALNTLTLNVLINLTTM